MLQEAAAGESAFFKKLYADVVVCVYHAPQLVYEQGVEGVINNKVYGFGGDSAMRVFGRHNDADSAAVVQGMVLEQVNNSNWLPGGDAAYHQPQFLGSEDVVAVVFDVLPQFPARIGRLCFAYVPEVAVVFDGVQEVEVFGLHLAQENLFASQLHPIFLHSFNRIVASCETL